MKVQKLSVILFNLLLLLTVFVISGLFPVARLILSVAILFGLITYAIGTKKYLWFLPVTGGTSNLVAVVANGGTMPVSTPGFTLDYSHSLLTAGTHLKFLCDIFHIGGNVIMSGGDFFFVGWLLTLFGIWVYTKYKKVRDANAL